MRRKADRPHDAAKARDTPDPAHVRPLPPQGDVGPHNAGRPAHMNVLHLCPIPIQTHADAPARARPRKTEPPGEARDEKDEKKKATDHALSLSAARMGWDKFFWGYRHYDLAGRAEGRTPPTTASTTHYVYDGDRLVGEYSGSGALLRRYAHGVGVDELLVWYEGAGLTDRRFMHADHQGSIIATSTGAGAGTAYVYGAFGEPKTERGLG